MEQKEIVQCVENSIKELIKVFCENPYFFYTENDIHCFIYRLLYNEMSEKDNWCAEINGKKVRTLPVHKEYPTREIYIKKEKSSNGRGTRRRFDIVVFHEKDIELFNFKEKPKRFNKYPAEPFIAIQIGLDYNLDHLKSDWKSLTDNKNCVNYKYLLHFDRKGQETIEDIKKVIIPCLNRINSKEVKGGICCIDVSEQSNYKILASKNLSVDCPPCVSVER